MGLLDIARALQARKRTDRLQIIKQKKIKGATYKGKDPVDGTDIVQVDGDDPTSGYRLISNKPISTGDRVSLRPSQGGLQRADAPNVAPVKVAEVIPEPLDVVIRITTFPNLILNDQSLFIVPPLGMVYSLPRRVFDVNDYENKVLGLGLPINNEPPPLSQTLSTDPPDEYYLGSSVITRGNNDPVFSVVVESLVFIEFLSEGITVTKGFKTFLIDFELMLSINSGAYAVVATNSVAKDNFILLSEPIELDVGDTSLDYYVRFKTPSKVNYYEL